MNNSNYDTEFLNNLKQQKAQNTGSKPPTLIPPDDPLHSIEHSVNIIRNIVVIMFVLFCIGFVLYLIQEIS